MPRANARQGSQQALARSFMVQERGVHVRVAVIGPEGLDTALVVALFRRRGLDAIGFSAAGRSNAALGPHTEVFSPSASPATTRLAHAFGLTPHRLEASAAFRRADGSTWLRSGPLGDGRRASPGLASLRYLSRDTLAVGLGLARLPASPKTLPPDLPLEAWLRRAHLPGAFVSAFLLPILSSALLLPPSAVAPLPASEALTLARALIDDTQLAMLPQGALGRLVSAEAGPLLPAAALTHGAVRDATGAHHAADALVMVTPVPRIDGLTPSADPTVHTTAIRVHTDTACLAADPRDRAHINYRVDTAASRVELTFALPGRPLVTLSPLHAAPQHDLHAHRALVAPVGPPGTDELARKVIRVGADLFPSLPPLEALAWSVEAALSELAAGA